MCTLCSKDVCTAAYILWAYKVSLQQKRYTFSHDTVLRKVTEALKTFILSLKEAVPISANSSIKFVKKWAKMRRKRAPPVSILHHASDWVLLPDLNSICCFPDHIAFNQLRPDITIFSNSLRKVILIELTCPGEENMESWHSTKINKYLALPQSKNLRVGVWNFLQWKLVLGDTTQYLFYAVLKRWISIINVSGTLLKN